VIEPKDFPYSSQTAEEVAAAAAAADIAVEEPVIMIAVDRTAVGTKPIAAAVVPELRMDYGYCSCLR
jgi:hypothetical protein